MNKKQVLAILFGVPVWYLIWGKMLTDGWMDLFAHPAQQHLSRHNPQQLHNIF